jgi:hypothetical protein
MEPESLNLYGDVADWQSPGMAVHNAQCGPMDGNYYGKEEGEE